MGKDAKPFRACTTLLPLDHASVTIEWQADASEDVLARLLLDLIGSDGIEEVMSENVD